MNSVTIEDYRSAMYEVAEAIAPTWERRRAEIEEVATYTLPGVTLCVVAS